MKVDRICEISFGCLKFDLEMWRKYVNEKSFDYAISYGNRIEGKLELIMLLGIMDFEDYWSIKEMLNRFDLEKWNEIIRKIELNL